MARSVFNTEFQQQQVTSKIVVGLERIAEVFKVLLWEHAKKIGLSPIQIQILIFIAFHKKELCKVSHLAKEFNVTKPTISDAVRLLESKKLIVKRLSTNDGRSNYLFLSSTGQSIVEQTGGFANPIKNQLDNIKTHQLEVLYDSLNQLIYGLNKVGILSIQRTCYGCTFYEKRDEKHFCNFLNTKLANHEIRLDCPEFSKKK